MPATTQVPALLQPSFHWIIQLWGDEDLQLHEGENLQLHEGKDLQLQEGEDLQLQGGLDLQLAGLDLPITSNVLTFSGGFSSVISLREVYRQAPGREVR